ncbi:cytochrome c oxidase assembly protein [Brackiella oedipodis]|uniref:cytochrome c oxidase assembly protein n=1 Tax=Brackiella oedipodis TaxID=124225 RepID=UPI00056E9AC6|nr:cytochrome c oxidase assembly protein [Brackiella oedipodis]
MDLNLSQWLQPWEFSPTLLFCFAVAALLFIRGCGVISVSRSRQLLFWAGYVLLYLCLHTHVDYFAERLFFAHRIQHVFLHHLAPLLVMAAYPWQVLRAGLPLTWRARLYRFRRSDKGRCVSALLTHKLLIPFMFVFLVIIWLFPTIQFYSMLNSHLYRLMNWSVVISGFLYWQLILDRRPSIAPDLKSSSLLGRCLESLNKAGYPAAMSLRERALSPIFTMVPQIIAGAFLAFSSQDIYPLFDLCGRALDISAVQDQNLGGLIMWVPAAVVETFGIVVAVMTAVRLSARGRLALAAPPHRRVTWQASQKSH